MEIISGVIGNKKLLQAFLMPSWLSGLLAVGISASIVCVTLILTHVGGTVQQSLLGLHNVYSQSSVGISVQTVAGNFAQNNYLNIVLLFLLWGSVGIFVYSIVRSIAKEVSDADKLVRELHYVNADRQTIIHGAITRAAIRLAAFVIWWVVFYLLAYKLVPYTIASSHVTALNLQDLGDWKRCLLAALGCALCFQALAILLRLIVLRIRVFGSSLIY